MEGVLKEAGCACCWLFWLLQFQLMNGGCGGRGGLSEGNDRGCLGKGAMERKKKRILMGGNRAGRRGVNK